MGVGEGVATGHLIQAMDRKEKPGRDGCGNISHASRWSEKRWKVRSYGEPSCGAFADSSRQAGKEFSGQVGETTKARPIKEKVDGDSLMEQNNAPKDSLKGSLGGLVAELALGKKGTRPATEERETLEHPFGNPTRRSTCQLFVVVVFPPCEQGKESKISD